MKQRLILLFFFISSLGAIEPGDLLKKTLEEGITVDLRNPELRGGTLTTTEGGVITAPGLRIQARSITYSRLKEEGARQILIVASGDLIVDYGDYHLVGETLTYDFITQTGTLTNGRSGYDAWYFGGELIELHADYSLTIHGAFLTTSDEIDSDWKLSFQNAHLTDDRNFVANNLRLHLGNVPTVWLPRFQTNLDWIRDNPFRYRLRWGGKQGVRLGITYLAFEWGRWKTFLRFDYRIKRGPGGGIETLWESSDKKQHLHTVNYIAHDSSVENENNFTRYRFEGGYHGHFDEGRTNLSLTYDKVSDDEMPNDYTDKGLAHKSVERTQFHLRRQQGQWWIANFNMRKKINDFQTVKEELPQITLSHHPWEIWCLGIITENRVSAGYLKLSFADDLPEDRDFDSTRVAWQGRLYRPFIFCGMSFTPFVEQLVINYSNTPNQGNHWLRATIFGGEIKTSIHKIYCSFKHIAEPYLFYEHVTTPTIGTHEHHIFDIEDGWHEMRKLKFGLRQHLFLFSPCHVLRNMTLDLYGYAFYKNAHSSETIPKVYGDLFWNITPYSRVIVDSSWDLARHQIGHLNTQLRWTWSDNLAFATEYRHRNAYTWRKADPDNFMMEAARSELILLNSPISDRRDTLIFHTFYRFLPNWSAEFEYRRGWNRRMITGLENQRQKDYVEYQLDIATVLRSQWQLKLSWQNREDDHRVVFYISLIGSQPKCHHQHDFH